MFCRSSALWVLEIRGGKAADAGGPGRPGDVFDRVDAARRSNWRHAEWLDRNRVATSRAVADAPVTGRGGNHLCHAARYVRTDTRERKPCASTPLACSACS